MMENKRIIRAREYGFCMGVRRAVEAVQRLLREQPGTPVRTLGPLIHNRVFLDELREQGVEIVSEPEEAPDGVVVIRAHGVGPEDREVLSRNGIGVVDATCPKVLRSQQKVREHAEAGCGVAIVGDAGHGEVQGLAGYAPGAFIVPDVEEAQRLIRSGELAERLFIIGQTTYRQEEYDRICEILRQARPDAEVDNSICGATRNRQDSLRELAGAVDALIVVGGRESANTTKLYQSAAATGKPAWHIEEASEVPREIGHFRTVGITAGASTPDTVIDAVQNRITELMDLMEET